MAERVSSKVRRIRKRASYREYAEFFALLITEPTLGELAGWFHERLDSRHAYGSETNAQYAFESLQQFCKDFKAQVRIGVTGNQEAQEMPMRRVISKSFPKKTRCLECGSAMKTAYALAGEGAEEHVLCAGCFADMLVREQAEVCTGNLEESLSTDAEICNECGRSVAPGSGWFVNRVLDFNSYEERVINGKPYPHGGFLCAECDLKFREEEA